MNSFTERAKTLLQQSGWSEERQIDISIYEAALRDEGYRVHLPVSALLRNLGGLHVHAPAPTREFHFDPILAVERTFRRMITDYSVRVDGDLCLIGEMANGYMALAMDEKGRMFAGIDDLLFSVGNSPTEAVDVLCSGKKLEKSAS